MSYIFHITHRSSWEKALQKGFYEAASLHTEGFIHCSTLTQVTRVANFLYKGQADLVLLKIDPVRLEAPVRYEAPENGEEKFPHIYGTLNANAVEGVLNFPPEPDGTFFLPLEA